MPIKWLNKIERPLEWSKKHSRMAPTNISFLDTIQELTNCKSHFIGKANSVQEACGKCYAVHLSKFEILQITWKN